jgi:hypothetical protein
VNSVDKLAALRGKAQIEAATGSGQYAALAVLLAWKPLTDDPRLRRHIEEDGEGIDFYAMLGVPSPGETEAAGTNSWSPGEDFLLSSAAGLFRGDRTGAFDVGLGRLGFLSDAEDRMWRDMIDAYLTHTVPDWARIAETEQTPR